jgi:CRP-like cAMP-binding protein
MSIEDDIALLARVPSLNLLGMSALQVLAIGTEQYDYGFGDVLFHKGDIADAGYVVRQGSFRISAGDGGAETTADVGELIGELALLHNMRRPATATALQQSSVIRLSRKLYQRVLESHPEAARRVRDDLEARTNEAAAALAQITAKLKR